MSEPHTHSTLLLGRDHVDYGEYHCATLANGRTAAVISVGSDPDSPSLRGKGDLAHPNEDALLARDDESKVLMAVADAHYGVEASHELLTGLDVTLPEIPVDPAGLERALATMPARDFDSDSKTTLLVAVYDRISRAGFGLSYGDSTLMLVGTRGARTINVREVQYVDPTRSRTYQPVEAYPFHFLARPGELILAFTDGIDECHYRSPETSIGARHLVELFARVGPEPRDFASRLVEMALAGVDGHPGGQDNVALVVSVA